MDWDLEIFEEHLSLEVELLDHCGTNGSCFLPVTLTMSCTGSCASSNPSSDIPWSSMTPSNIQNRNCAPPPHNRRDTGQRRISVPHHWVWGNVLHPYHPPPSLYSHSPSSPNIGWPRPLLPSVQRLADCQLAMCPFLCLYPSLTINNTWTDASAICTFYTSHSDNIL